MRLSMAVLSLLALTAASAAAQPDGQLAFDGEARLGGEVRPASFAFLCATPGPATSGALSLELYVASHDDFRSAFDFDAFEGPQANAGRRTRIGATREEAEASPPVSVAGWISGPGNGPPGRGLPFGFGLSAGLRRGGARLEIVRALASRIVDGPGTVVWIQGNTRAGRPPIVATLRLDEASREALRRALRPCLSGAR